MVSASSVPIKPRLISEPSRGQFSKKAFASQGVLHSSAKQSQNSKGTVIRRKELAILESRIFAGEEEICQQSRRGHKLNSISSESQEALIYRDGQVDSTVMVFNEAANDSTRVYRNWPYNDEKTKLGL